MAGGRFAAAEQSARRFFLGVAPQAYRGMLRPKLTDVQPD